MSEIHELLTGLVDEIVSINCTTPGCLPKNRNDLIQDSINTAADQIKAQQRGRVEKLETAFTMAWGIVHSRHDTSAIQENEMDSCTNYNCQRLQAALKELEDIHDP